MRVSAIVDVMRILSIGLLWVIGPMAVFGQMGKPRGTDLGHDGRLSDASGTSPTLAPVEMALLEKVDLLIETNISQARAMLEALVFGENPASAYFDYALGVVYMTDRRYKDAEDQFMRAIGKFADFRRAWVELGTIRYLGNDFNGAINALSKAVELGASDANTFGILGYCHMQEENFMAADAAYDSALLIEPNNLNWLEGKAFVLVESGEYEEAVRALRELIKMDPMNANYWLLQSNTYLALDRPLKAARNIEIVRTMEAADAEAILLLANIYMRAGIFDRAAEHYLAAFEQHEGKDSLLALQVANQMFRKGQFKRAKAIFAAIGDDKTGWKLEDLTRLGYLQAEFAVLEGNDELGIRILTTVLEANPFEGKCLTKLAELYANQGNKAKAYYLLDRVQEGSEFEFRSLLLYVHLLIEDERYAQSLKIIERALGIRSSSALEKLYERVRVAAATAHRDSGD